MGRLPHRGRSPKQQRHAVTTHGAYQTFSLQVHL